MKYRMFATIAIIVESAFALIGCGSDSTQQGNTSGNNPTGYDNDAIYCSARVARQVECSGMPASATAVDQCKKSVACEFNVYRTDFVLGRRECLADTPCADSTDMCLQDVYSNIEASSIATAFMNACTPRNTECGMQGFGFAADYCQEAAIRNDAILSKMQNCLNETCDNVKNCLLTLDYEAQASCL